MTKDQTYFYKKIRKLYDQYLIEFEKGYQPKLSFRDVNPTKPILIDNILIRERVSYTKKTIFSDDEIRNFAYEVSTEVKEILRKEELDYSRYRVSLYYKAIVFFLVAYGFGELFLKYSFSSMNLVFIIISIILLVFEKTRESMIRNWDKYYSEHEPYLSIDNLKRISVYIKKRTGL